MPMLKLLGVIRGRKFYDIGLIIAENKNYLDCVIIMVQ